MRHRYAEALAAAPGVTDERVVRAFDAVPRERFLGPGPWLIAGKDGYAPSSDDEAAIYDDVVVALVADKRINNGQPSLHARLLSAAAVRPGEHVLHIGCGTGYYTAILAELVGQDGSVAAWDVEPTLVARAREYLADRPNVEVSLRSGLEPPIPRSDLIYASTGFTTPAKPWTDALAEGGRLVFPLTPGWGWGGMLLVTRRGDRLDARFICRVSFIPAVGGSNDAEAEALQGAFLHGGMEEVRSLHYGTNAPPDAWFAGNGWWLGR